MLVGDDAGSHWIGSWVEPNAASNMIVSNGYQANDSSFYRRKIGQESWMIGNYITNGNQGNFTIWHAAAESTSKISKFSPLFKITGYGDGYLDGILRVKQLIVKSNIWADYVFDDNYKLMSLSEVESYIKENNHLPNIPTQKEIEEEGLSLGEMQRLQMEKIEELTLYTIEQDKEINQLEAQNFKLNERLERLEKLLL